MTALKDYIELKKRIEQFGRTADRAAGVLGQMMKQFKNDFNCSSLKEAKKKAKLLKKQKQEAKISFIKEKERFEKKYELNDD